MKRYKKITTMLIIAATFVVGVMHARVRSVNARRDFEQSLSKDTMVVAFFYESSKRNSKARVDHKQAMRMYEDVSGYQPYDDADIIFLKVNVGRSELADLAKLYNVEEVPSFIFFKNGKRVTDRQGQIIVLDDSVTRADLQALIDELYGADIQKRIDEKKQRTQGLVKEENEAWKQYFYPRDIFVRGYAPAERMHNME